jgi:hypothetical protein
LKFLEAGEQDGGKSLIPKAIDADDEDDGSSDDDSDNEVSPRSHHSSASLPRFLAVQWSKDAHSFLGKKIISSSSFRQCINCRIRSTLSHRTVSVLLFSYFHPSTAFCFDLP